MKTLDHLTGLPIPLIFQLTNLRGMLDPAMLGSILPLTIHKEEDKNNNNKKQVQVTLNTNTPQVSTEQNKGDSSVPPK